MTELIQSATDDQVALTICFAAVAFSGLVMYFSHYVGRLTGRAGMHERRTLPMSGTPAPSPGSKPAAGSAVREKAA